MVERMSRTRVLVEAVNGLSQCGSPKPADWLPQLKTNRRPRAEGLCMLQQLFQGATS